MRVKPDEYPAYISNLVIDLIKKKSFLNVREEELKDIGAQLGIADLDKKVSAFLTTYYDIWSDGNVSNVEKRKFQFLGKGLKMPEETVEKLLNKKI